MIKLPKDILGFDRVQHILGFNDSGLYFFGCIISTIITMAILYMDLFLSGPFNRFIGLWIGVFCYIVLHWYLMRIFYLCLVKRFPGYDNRLKRIIRIPLVLLIYFFLTFILDFLLDSIPGIEDPLRQKPLLVKELVTGVFMITVSIGIYEALHLSAELRNTKIKQTKLEKEHLSFQLANLRNQISPHFLFNCFNTLLYLIDEDKEKGKEFVHKLSYIYKSILESSSKDLVTVEEELRFIGAYIDLLKERFGTNLNVKLHIGSAEKKKKIIPLAIQVGVENAVKHNTISKKTPLSIDIGGQDGYIAIINTLQPKPAKAFGHGLGIKNIIDRYKMITDKEVIVEKEELAFVLKLPLLTE